ncbi:MAG: hypothetical protein LKG27_02125 [Clostridiaceae bacterium]|jgi:hypothetical protein|nr:hypothetical protein [Clostridiaceae bacterium]
MKVEGLTPNINQYMPKSVRFFSKYRKMMGERQDIILNAVGTGVVAPIFINYNSLSKSDKNTKTYSALRQTAMAIIAVVVQAGITIPIDKYIDKMIKKGQLGDKFTLQNPENIKAFRRILPLGVALFTIPFSCWILNKTYPKFMDKFFPKISNNKEIKK